MKLDSNKDTQMLFIMHNLNSEQLSTVRQVEVKEQIDHHQSWKVVMHEQFKAWIKTELEPRILWTTEQ